MLQNHVLNVRWVLFQAAPSLFFIYLLCSFVLYKELHYTSVCFKITYYTYVGLSFSGCFRVIHLFGAIFSYVTSSKQLCQHPSAPKSGTACTLGFVSDGCFIVLHLFGALLQTALSLLLYYTVFHSKHLFLSIEKAERLNARLILLFAVQIDFYAEIFVRKE